MADSGRDRMESKLPQLLIDGSTGEKENFNEYRRMDYHLRQLKKNNPALYNHHVNAITAAAQALKICILGIQSGREPIVEWGYGAVKREFERQKTQKC